MINELKQFMNMLNNDPEFWSCYAKLYWNAFSALRDIGFTEQMALEIISRQGPGTPTGK